MREQPRVGREGHRPVKDQRHRHRLPRPGSPRRDRRSRRHPPTSARAEIRDPAALAARRAGRRAGGVAASRTPRSGRVGPAPDGSSGSAMARRRAFAGRRCSRSSADGSPRPRSWPAAAGGGRTARPVRPRSRRGNGSSILSGPAPRPGPGHPGGARAAGGRAALRSTRRSAGTASLGPVLVIIDQVLQRRHRAPMIERVALVRDRVKQDAARTELAEMGLERADRVLAVLEEVIGDDEVLRLGLDGVEPLPVVDHVDRREIEIGELRVVLAQLRRRTSDRRSGPGRRAASHRQVQGPDLEALAAQICLGELEARVAERLGGGQGASSADASGTGCRAAGWWTRAHTVPIG